MLRVLNLNRQGREPRLGDPTGQILNELASRRELPESMFRGYLPCTGTGNEHPVAGVGDDRPRVVREPGIIE